MGKRFLITLLGLLCVTCLSTYAADDRFPVQRTYQNGQFTDVEESSWYGAEQQGVIRQMYETGIMDGTGGGLFEPDGNIRICEAIKIAAVVNSLSGGEQYSFKQDGIWYLPYVDYALSHGIIKDGDFSDYTAYAARKEIAHIFAGCINEEPEINTVNGILDVPFISWDDFYRDDILKLYRTGIAAGSDEWNRFYPDSLITRAETAAIVSRIIDKSSRISMELLTMDGDSRLYEEYGIYNEAGVKLSLGYQPKAKLDEFLAGTDTQLTADSIVYDAFLAPTTAKNILRKEENSFDIAYLESDSASGYIYIYFISALNQNQTDVGGIRIGDTED